jgi:hypothetical protein
MKKIIIATTVLAALAPMSNAFAAASASGAVTDVQVSTSGNGYVRVKITGANINDGCTSGNTNLFYAERSGNTYFEAFLSMAMTAKSTSSDLLVGVNGCVAIGATTYPKINYLKL